MEGIGIHRMRVYEEYHYMKVVMMGCETGIREVEISFNNNKLKCLVKRRHLMDFNGSNFEVAKPGHSLFIAY